jgi:acetolactate synthase-1/2/3 large subunit
MHANVLSDVPLICDASAGLAALEDAVAALGATPARWTPTGAAQAAAEEQARPWSPWIAALEAALPSTATVVGDLAMACYYGVARTLRMRPPGRFLYPSGLGTLGYALPAAVGAALAEPPGPVVAWCGDGGLMFTVAELAAAAQLRLALPVIVTVNHGWGQIRNVMRTAGVEPIGVSFPAPDLVGLARALGAEGVRVDAPEHLGSALDAALMRATPTVIAVPEPATASGTDTEKR